MECIQEEFKSVTNLLLQFIFAVVDGDAVIMPIETVYESLKKKRRENFEEIQQKTSSLFVAVEKHVET